MGDTHSPLWPFLFVSWLVLWPALGRWIALQKGRSFREGVVLALVFGPLGILVEALLPNRDY